MGFTFKIGNAVPEHDKTDFPYLSARWIVEDAHHEAAPSDIAGYEDQRSCISRSSFSAISISRSASSRSFRAFSLLC